MINMSCPFYNNNNINPYYYPNQHMTTPYFYPVPVPLPPPCIQQNISLPETIEIELISAVGIATLPTITFNTSISNGVFVYNSGTFDPATTTQTIYLQSGCSGFAVSAVKCPPTSTSITIDTFTIAGFTFSSQKVKLDTSNGVYNATVTSISGAICSFIFVTCYQNSNWVISKITLFLWVPPVF